MKPLYLAAAILFAASTAAFAGPIEAYIARLSEADHYNSSDELLTSAAAIIRQDRANLYIYGKGEDEDEGDNFSLDKANRAKIERMLNKGTFTNATKRAILNGTPLVYVEIYRDFINVSVESD